MSVTLALPREPVTNLPLSALRPARCRARQANTDAGISELAASVAEEGVREPILVRRLESDADIYEVVAGERRRLAAERAGCADVPAVVVEADDAEALTLSLAENLGRQDFSPLDESRAYLRLMTEYRVNPSILAQRLARERTHIALALRLLGLPERVRQTIDGGELAPAQVYALLSARDPETMAEQMIRGVPPGPAPDPA
jgi:ParB family chromosome partitioning protein